MNSQGAFWCRCLCAPMGLCEQGVDLSGFKYFDTILGKKYTVYHSQCIVCTHKHMHMCALALTYRDTHSYCTGVFSTPLHSAPFNSTSFHSTVFHSTPFDSTPLHPTPLHSIPFYCTPLHSTPLHSTLLLSILFHSTPFLSIPFCSTPLHFTLLHSTPFHSTPLHFTPFCSTPLYSIPLHSIPFHSILFHGTPLFSMSSYFHLLSYKTSPSYLPDLQQIFCGIQKHFPGERPEIPGSDPRPLQPSEGLVLIRSPIWACPALLQGLSGALCLLCAVRDKVPSKD